GTIMELDADGNVKTTEDAIQVISGIVAPFLFKDKDEEAKFIGKKVNDKVVFNPYKTCEGNVTELSSMLNIDKEKAADVKSDFEFAISEIIVVKLADYNQEYFDEVFGKDQVHNEEEYFAAVKKMIEAQLFPNSLQLSDRDIHNWLLEKYGPEMVIDNELLKRWMVLNNPEADAKKLDEEFDSMLPGIKWELLSGLIVDKLGVKIEEADMQGQANLLARRQLQQYGMYNMDEETIADMGKRLLADKKIRQQIAQQVEEFKLFQAIRNAITIEQKTVSLDEFKKLAGAAE
ncbi:MAG: trigger factor, partial [Muribaculaceae bacterium]|nr:trigger factor [Muribaculaceae bacterium]